MKPSASSEAAVSISAVVQDYGSKTKALNSVSLEVPAGQLVALVGESGAGKSSLLRLINGIDKATAGKVQVFGLDVDQLSRRELRELRKDVAIIFQDFGLVSRFSALETVLTGSLGRLRLPRLGISSYPKALREEALETLSRVGLKKHALQRVSSLSGGQIQRVAIARALFQKPRILLADEPVSSLDPETAISIMKLLSDIATKDNLTVIASLHQVELALNWSTRVIGLRAGKIVLDTDTSKLSKSALKDFYKVPKRTGEKSKAKAQKPKTPASKTRTSKTPRV